MAQARTSSRESGPTASAVIWTAYWNGRFVPDTEVQISPWDRGFMMADAAYEATRTFAHVPFHLDWHLDRLMKTLAYLRLDPGLSRAELEALTLAVLERNRSHLRSHDDVVLTHRITRGAFRGSFASADGPPTVLILCRPMNFAAFARYYDEGLEVEIPSIRAPAAGGLDPRAKTHNRLLLTLGHVQIGHLRPGVVPLLIDVNDYVTESAAANIHYVIGDEMVTPLDEVALEGVTRRTLMLVAAAAGVRVARRPVHRGELRSAQEAIVTASSFSMLPVRALDGRTLSPVPGPVTRKLTAAFSAHAGVDIIAQSRAHLSRR